MKTDSQWLVFAGIAQLGERQTEDLKVPGSIPGHGTFLFSFLRLKQDTFDMFGSRCYACLILYYC